MPVQQQQMSELSEKVGAALSAEPEKPNTSGLNDEELAAKAVLEGEQHDDTGSGDEEEAAAEAQAAEEVAEEEEAGSEDAGAADAEAGEGAETYTPQQLAEAIGWEAADVYDGLIIPLDDGQDPVTLGEFKNQYQNMNRERDQLQQQLDGQADQIAEAQKTATLGQQMSMEMVQAVGYLQSLERMEANTDWAELEKYNASEAVLKRQKFADAKKDVEQQIGQLQQREQQMRGQMVQQAKVKMVELIPTWSDDSARKADQEVIRTTMKGVGFADQEINHIMDPRTMSLLKRLIDAESKIAAAEGAVKKVRQAPKVLRGAGGRFQKANPKQAKQLKVNQAKQTGKKGDQLAAAKAILGMK